MATSFHGPPVRLHDFVITCKRCKKNIAAPIQTMPDTWIIAQCPLCGEKRRYLPAEIFKGRLSGDFETWVHQRGRNVNREITPAQAFGVLIQRIDRRKEVLSRMGNEITYSVSSPSWISFAFNW
jgi:hypothetical protein